MFKSALALQCAKFDNSIELEYINSKPGGIR
jgi:hypothetical protein